MLHFHSSKRFQAPSLSTAAKVGIIIYRFTGYRNRAYKAGRRAFWEAWRSYAAGLQAELDAQRAQGYGYSYLTGRRVSR